MRALDLIKVFFRSFLVQAAWNYERLQNAGFVYGILPAIRKLYPDKSKRLQVIKSYLDFFNTHPYMVGILMGMTISLEEKMANTKEGTTSREMIHASINNMACPLAAIGDTFFWAVWRPFCALLIVVPVAIYFAEIKGVFIWLFFFIFLLIYNSMNFSIRYFGVIKGYQFREKIVREISHWNIQRFISTVRAAGLIAVCAAMVVYFIINLHGTREKILALFIFIGGAYFYRRGITSTKLFYCLIIIFIIISFMGI